MKCDMFVSSLTSVPNWSSCSARKRNVLKEMACGCTAFISEEKMGTVWDAAEKTVPCAEGEW